MEGLQVHRPPPVKIEPDTDKIKRRLLKYGVQPTPKIIHTLRKKEIQKHSRKLKRLAEQDETPRLTKIQKQEIAEEYQFQTLKREYTEFTKAMEAKAGKANKEALMVGKPWEDIKKIGLLQLVKGYKEYRGEKLKRESLHELKEMFESRMRDELKWVLDDDIEMKPEWFNEEDGEIGSRTQRPKRKSTEAQMISFLVDRLSAREITIKDWKFTRIMKLSELQYTEAQLLKILDGLGARGSWKQAMSVVEWVYDDRKHKNYKSRFVYTKLLAVLGKARRPKEGLQIFKLMQGDCHTYPDMAAYHSIAVTLGQAGLLIELLNIMERMKQKPSKGVKNIYKYWDPILEPDVVIYNSVLNACVSSNQWKGVLWVFKQLRKSGLKPNGATYGLAMEVMLHSGKYDLVHQLFRKMIRSGEAPKALTYKVLVRAFWAEDKIFRAVQVVRDMERRGVLGIGSVYYELACCLCNKGRWQDAIKEVEKMKKLTHTRPLEVTFTGMILSAMDGGYIDDCVSLFEQMKEHCTPNIGTINAMLKVYGKNDMFSKAKELFEEIKGAESENDPSVIISAGFLEPDRYTYTSILEASASALQWEYFEYVYREMVLSGYQLDHSKHPSLLVKASKAGKWYLLEHAIDTMLEAEEIPPQHYFTELLVQYIAQENFSRAVVLVNTMAYAPFQISEVEWRELFKQNKDRITEQVLAQWLEVLGRSDLASEATISNLFSSFSNAAISETGKLAFSSATEGKTTPEGFHLNRPTCLSDNSDIAPYEDPTDSDDDDLLETFGMNHDSIDGRGCLSNPMAFKPTGEGCKEDTRTKTYPPIQDFFGNDSASEKSCNGLGYDFKKLISKAGLGVEDKVLLEPPSADDILEAWENSRTEEDVSAIEPPSPRLVD